MTDGRQRFANCIGVVGVGISGEELGVVFINRTQVGGKKARSVEAVYDESMTATARCPRQNQENTWFFP
jgi:hypothetical protein